MIPRLNIPNWFARLHPSKVEYCKKTRKVKQGFKWMTFCVFAVYQFKVHWGLMNELRFDHFLLLNFSSVGKKVIAYWNSRDWRHLVIFLRAFCKEGVIRCKQVCGSAFIGGVHPQAAHVTWTNSLVGLHTALRRISIQCNLASARNFAIAFFWIVFSHPYLKADFHSVQNVARSTFSEHFLLNYKQSSGTNLISCGWLHTFQKKALAKNRSRDVLHWMEIRLNAIRSTWQHTFQKKAITQNRALAKLHWMEISL